ncbi:hypothetical protein BGZ61DRAFT_485581 [Ilyonectria robusta]|uniref:uncharacterized protein n=1 Tax=Ilyonectria robusta TaxID=1079257 RepID=UPI001E8DAAB1|nr:uncharacterized protein BGZ61DRAFT_485581 [Ilyonectria robusta]KAH8661032.1 hypothetical protein BGZ61DRAFT_485581 [Ilyonectria robusta]
MYTIVFRGTGAGSDSARHATAGRELGIDVARRPPSHTLRPSRREGRRMCWQWWGHVAVGAREDGRDAKLGKRDTRGLSLMSYTRVTICLPTSARWQSILVVAHDGTPRSGRLGAGECGPGNAAPDSDRGRQGGEKGEAQPRGRDRARHFDGNGERGGIERGEKGGGDAKVGERRFIEGHKAARG